MAMRVIIGNVLQFSTYDSSLSLYNFYIIIYNLYKSRARRPILLSD